MPSTGYWCTRGALRLINLPPHDLLFLFVSLQSLWPRLCFSIEPELPPLCRGFTTRLSGQFPCKTGVANKQRARNFSPKLFCGEATQGADCPGAALGPAQLGQGKARATVTGPGRRQSCSACKQHLPKASLLILMASSTAICYRPLCVAPAALLGANTSGSSGTSSCGPAPPAISLLSWRGVCPSDASLGKKSSSEAFFQQKKNTFSTKTESVQY